MVIQRRDLRLRGDDHEKIFIKSYEKVKKESLKSHTKVNPLSHAWETLKVKFNRFLYERKIKEPINQKQIKEMKSSLSSLLTEVQEEQTKYLEKEDLDEDIGVLRYAVMQTKQIIEELKEAKTDNSELQDVSSKLKDLQEALKKFVHQRNLIEIRPRRLPEKTEGTSQISNGADYRVAVIPPSITTVIAPLRSLVPDALFSAIEQKQLRKIEFTLQDPQVKYLIILNFGESGFIRLEEEFGIQPFTLETREPGQFVCRCPVRKGEEFPLTLVYEKTAVVPEKSIQSVKAPPSERLIKAKSKLKKRFIEIKNLYNAFKKSLEKYPSKTEEINKIREDFNRDIKLITSGDVEPEQEHFLKGQDLVPIEIWNKQVKVLLHEKLNILDKVLKSGDRVIQSEKPLRGIGFKPQEEVSLPPYLQFPNQDFPNPGLQALEFQDFSDFKLEGMNAVGEPAVQEMHRSEILGSTKGLSIYKMIAIFAGLAFTVKSLDTIAKTAYYAPPFHTELFDLKTKGTLLNHTVKELHPSTLQATIVAKSGTRTYEYSTAFNELDKLRAQLKKIVSEDDPIMLEFNRNYSKCRIKSHVSILSLSDDQFDQLKRDMAQLSISTKAYLKTMGAKVDENLKTERTEANTKGIAVVLLLVAIVIAAAKGYFFGKAEISPETLALIKQDTERFQQALSNSSFNKVLFMSELELSFRDYKVYRVNKGSLPKEDLERFEAIARIMAARSDPDIFKRWRSDMLGRLPSDKNEER